MQNTCRKEECKFWKKYKTGCPFFARNPWYDGKTGDVVKVLDDCAHHRSVELMKDLTRMVRESRIALQKASEQERNKYHRVLGAVNEVAKIQTAKREQIENGRH